MSNNIHTKQITPRCSYTGCTRHAVSRTATGWNACERHNTERNQA